MNPFRNKSNKGKARPQNLLQVFRDRLLFPALLSLSALLLLFLSVPAFAQSSLRLSSKVNLLYHESGEKQSWDIYSLETASEANIPVFGSVLKVSAGGERGVISFENHRVSQSVLLEQNTLIAGVGAELFFSAVKLTPQIRVFSGTGSSRLGWSADASIETVPGLTFSAGSGQRYQQYLHRWKVEDIRPEFSQWSKITDWRAGAEWTGSNWGTLKAEYTGSTADVQPVTSLFRETGSFPAENLLLSGSVWFLENWRITADGTWYQGQGTPEWAFKRFPFASFTESDFKKSDFSGELAWAVTPNWVVSAKGFRQKLSLTSGAVLQSFPFTPAVISLLGDYYFVSLDAAETTAGISAAVERSSASQYPFKLSIGWQRTWPELDLQTWEPVFLLIGRRNERLTAFTYRFIDFAAIRVSGAWSWESVRLEAEAGQLIPVYSERAKKTSSGSGGGSGGSSGGSARTDKTIWGGTDGTIRITFQF